MFGRQSQVNDLYRTLEAAQDEIASLRTRVAELERELVVKDRELDAKDRRLRESQADQLATVCDLDRLRSKLRRTPWGRLALPEAAR